MGLALYKILFMTELLLAEILFTFRVPKRKHFWLRAVIACIVCYVIAISYPIKGEYVYTSWYISLMFVFFFVVTYFALLFVYDGESNNIFFCAITAYTVEHFAYGIVSMAFSLIGNFDISTMYTSSIFDFSKFDLGTVIVILVYISIYLLIYGLCYLLLAPNLKKTNGLKIRSTKVLILATFFFFVDIILNAIVLYDNIEGIAKYILCIYNILSCCLIFYIQLNLIEGKVKEQEVEYISEALKQAKIQYQQQKENINLINVKCHDIKYQISLYALQGGMDKKTVDELEKMIFIYDSKVNTGNTVLDVIIAEKMLLCHDKNIKFSYTINNFDFENISEGDLYALFGNIIDNAIEAVSKIEEKEKRCITLNVRKCNGFTAIQAMNYFEGNIIFSEEGFPTTTKENKERHGFGVRSIAMIAEKYNGNVLFSTEEDVFRLNIAFPPNRR